MRTRDPARRRRSLLAPGLLAAGALATLIVEAVAGRSGTTSATPAGAADGLVGSADGRPLVLVVLGDSTGAAVGASDIGHGYPRLIARALSEAVSRPVQLHVLSVSGARVRDVRNLQLPRLPTLDPDLVLIVVGANDVTHLTGRRAARRDLRAVIHGCAQTGATVVVAGIPAMGTTRRVAEPLRSVLGWIGHRLDRVWHDETASGSALRVELAAETGSAFAADPSLFSADRFHPADAGYAIWADVLARGVIAGYRLAPRGPLSGPLR